MSACFSTPPLARRYRTPRALHSASYSQRLTTAARVICKPRQVLLPDLKQLPSLLDPSLHARAQTVRNEGPQLRASKQPITDDNFMTLFAEKKLPSWGHSHRLRVLYAPPLRPVYVIVVW